MTTHPHAATADPTLPPIGSLVAGRYQVARVRGRGMMGVVVEAIDRASGQHVALKILRPEIYASDELRARLEREAAVVAQLRSEHVVRVYGFAHTPEGLPFFVMELLEGSDLDERLRLGTRFSIPEAVGLVRQACEAVAEAHALGVVHRDIKPHNLFLARLPDGRTVLKVLDFGVSKIVNDDAHLTATQVSLGTPLYMPPEQVRSARTIDGRADVWALGTVLFELITGRCPFDGATSHAVIASIIADEPLRLRALVPDAPELLERVILSTLAKDPARRLPSAAALRDALLPFEDARAPDAFAATELANAAAIDDEPTALDTNAATQLGVPVGFDGAPIAAATLHGPTPAGPAATKVDPIPPLAAWAPPAATYVPPAQPSYPQAYPSAPGAPPASPSAPGSRPQNLAPTPVAGSRPARPAPTPTSPAKIALAAIGLPLAAVAVVALIWFGLRRRHATSNTSSSGAPAASISSGPASDETTVAQALARMPNSRAGWSPCIFREGGALPAVLPLPTMPSAIDIDALSPNDPPRPLLDLPNGGPPAEGPSVLRLSPVTPLTRAARLETLPVVFVTRSNLYLGLTGETGLEDLTTPESRAALEDGLVLTAPGWIVVPSGSLKLTRLYTALKLLEKARASVMLAVPVAKDAPRARGGGTPSDDTACDDTGVEVERPSSDNTTLRKLVTQAADQCGSPGPAAGGRSLTLHAKRGSSATSADVCVTTDEAGSPEFRSCAVAALRRSLATPLKNQKNPLELELVLEGPRVTAICPATP